MPQVLIIDDSRLAAMVVQRLLKAREIDCPHIQTVQELFGLRGAHCKLRDVSPDVILLDIMMPEMDGLDVLLRLKARKDTQQVPVVMLSADSSASTVTESINRGAAGFLTKPVDQKQLMAKLLEVAKSCDLENLRRLLTGDMGSARETELDHDEMKAGPANLNYLLDILDGDRSMIGLMITAFLESAPEQIEDIGKAVEAGNADGVKRTAHRFKGAVGNFGAPIITDTAFDLEKMGASGNLEKAHLVYESLAEDGKTLCEALKKWLDENE